MLFNLINVQGTSSFATYIPALLGSDTKQAMPLGRQRDRKARQAERHSRRWAIIAAEMANRRAKEISKLLPVTAVLKNLLTLEYSVK
jgi:hypothetical protein